MRSHPSTFEMVQPATLANVLALMAQEPGTWMPVAGGTEVMVQFGAGRLATRRLINIQPLPELRCITATENEVHIGAACTYTDIRNSAILCDEFPLLSAAAAWTGSIANQNRGTLGGNIVNASPAADSLPALLVYEAELRLVSSRGERQVPYNGFHTGYKTTCLQPDELIQAIVLSRRYREWKSSARKVGPRNAQAISKICMAALARTSGQQVEEFRIAFGSMAPVPLRLTGVEGTIAGRVIDEGVLRSARIALQAEVSPIDDIRSTRAYRIAVAANLLEEFLRTITQQNLIMARWNQQHADDAAREILSCCGSEKWAMEMAASRPMPDEMLLFNRASEIWRGLNQDDWMQAFRSHPRIGERHAERATTATSARWSAGEQSQALKNDSEIARTLAGANRRYEERFGRIFIICATGKSSTEILRELERRLMNDQETELEETAAQQEQIMQLRLRKWLSQGEDQ